jgi:hypothetical protein
MRPYGFEEEEERRPWTPTNVLALCVFLGIAAIIIAFVARQPIMESLRLQSNEQARLYREEQHKARAKVLADDLTVLVARAYDDLEALELAHEEFRREFRGVVGLSVKFVAQHPGERGAAVNDAILKFDDFAMAWSQLLNADVGERWLDASWQALYGVEHRVDVNVAVPRDKVNVREILIAARAKLRLIREQSDNLNLVRDRLATEKLRKTLTSMERRKP